jgi:hypothetical protein
MKRIRDKVATFLISLSILAVALAFAATVHAQELTSNPTTTVAPQVEPDPQDTKTPPVVSNSPRPHFAPMNRDERFHHYLSNVFGYEVILRSAVGAGIRQANGIPEEWGGGTEGYARRFASGFGQHFVSGTLQYGISSVLHEDNRYFASGETGTFRRLTYAIKSTVLARHDNGNQYFSVSHVAGTAGGAFISRTWSPPSVSDAKHGAVSFGVSMSYAMGFNVFREFWPDVKRIF